MPVIVWIIGTSIAGGVLSILLAWAFAIKVAPSRIPLLISYAVGALLGAVFLEILPHAIEQSKDTKSMAMTILAGILLFFFLEKLVLWRHCHVEQCEAHDPHVATHDHGRSGLLIMVGNTFHNFVDGILIAAAFLVDIKLGVITAIAIIAHEIPQEVGDFLILLHSGYSRKKALLVNLLSSIATLLGGVLTYFTLQSMQQWTGPLLGLAAASMIYVSVADLIPGLHKRPEIHATIQQLVLIGLGIGSIGLADYLIHTII